jgi:ribosomal protein S18 acetylase RimI-like enzyme
MEPIMALCLAPATATDRKRIARIRAPIGMGHFVHFNWFWLDRALADPEIQFSLILGGSRGGVTGCLAYGPHEAVDLVPSSRMPGVGEIYHIVIDRKHAGQGQGQGAHAIAAGIEALRAIDPNLKAVRVSRHANNEAAARLYARLGFVEIGEKIDGETGIHDQLLEFSFPPSTVEETAQPPLS